MGSEGGGGGGGGGASCVSSRGGTALSTAASRERWDIVEFLLENGADPWHKKPCTGKGTFASVAEKAAAIPWEKTEDLERYLACLCGMLPGSPVEPVPPPAGALDNLLAQMIIEVKRKNEDGQGLT